MKWNRMRGFCPSNLQELRMKLSSTIGELRRRPDVLASFYALRGQLAAPDRR
ncbi:MAG: hypothetical protein ACP5L2_07825 [Conexivisphaera sp.]